MDTHDVAFKENKHKWKIDFNHLSIVLLLMGIIIIYIQMYAP